MNSSPEQIRAPTGPKIPSFQRNGSGKTIQRSKPSKACVPCRSRKVKCDAALIGLPCSRCVSRKCSASCVLSARKRRKRTSALPLAAVQHDRELASQIATSETFQENVDDGAHFIRADSADRVLEVESPSLPGESSPLQDDQYSLQTRPDLHYLSILKDAVDDMGHNQQQVAVNGSSFNSEQSVDLMSRIRLWNKLPPKDDADNEFLVKKGVYDLPPQPHMDALIKAYFDYVHPFLSIFDRIDFMRAYRSGSPSLFLLYAVLAGSAIYAPMDAISGCGVSSRGAAQALFFSKAKLLHDFECESDALSMLQGSIILSIIILDHPTDRDYGFWFHNSVRLAARLDIHNMSIRGGACKHSRLYRRIWWNLYCHDVFHSFVNTKNMRLFSSQSLLQPITQDDWEAEDIPEDFASVLKPILEQQKASFIAHCTLAQIAGKCLSSVISEHQQHPRQLMAPIDEWRMSLTERTRIHDGSHDGGIYYAGVVAISYRYEAVMGRMLRRQWRSKDTERSDFAKQRLQSAMVELDVFVKRLLTNGRLHTCPMTCITGITTLLALHIEFALDVNEAELTRSMSRMSIDQTMLVLGQLKEIPAIRRALPIFEMVLSKKGLVPMSANQSMPHHSEAVLNENCQRSEEVTVDGDYGALLSRDMTGEYNPLFENFTGFDFLDNWDLGGSVFAKV